MNLTRVCQAPDRWSYMAWRSIWALCCDQNCNKDIRKRLRFLLSPSVYAVIINLRRHFLNPKGIDVSTQFGSYRVTEGRHHCLLSQDTLPQYSTDCSGVILSR
jgi:hypothetical protein